MTIKAEGYLVSAAMDNPDAYFQVAWLHPEWFSQGAATWRAIAALYTENAGIGMLTPEVVAFKVAAMDKHITDVEQINLRDALRALDRQHVPYYHVETYAAEVFRGAVQRRVKALTDEIGQFDAGLDAEALIASVNEKVEAALAAFVRTESVASKEAASAAYESLVHRVEHPGISGIPTGMADLDRIMGGMQLGDLIVLSGRPSMGKTASMLCLVKASATNAMLKRSGDVAVFSLEMTTDQLMQRLAANLAGIDSMKLRDGTLNTDELTLVGEKLGEIATWPVQWIDQPALTVHDIEQSAWQMYRGTRGLSAIFIDQLQLISVPDENKFYNEVREYTKIVRRLRRLAKQLHIPVVLLHQINRGVEQRAEKRPTMSDLKGSGGLEEVPDTVLLLYRDEYYNPETDYPNLLEWIVGKQRNGMTGTALTYYKKETGRIGGVTVQTHSLDY